MMHNFHSSILLKISALITLLCLIIMSYSAYGLFLGWTNYHQATELQVVQDMMQSFSVGLKNFMFERGRMNVVLSKQQPISDENSAFLNERRSASDQAFQAGFSALEKAFPMETESLRKEYEKINILRLKIDAEAKKPLSERDENARKLWFNSCTDCIDTIITSINVIRQLSKNNSDISNYFDIVVDSLYFRNIVGNESSIITSAIGGNGTLSKEDDSALLFLRGEETQVWSQLEKTVRMMNADNLTVALEDVREQYYLRFRIEQERIIELAHKNQLYEGADKEIANLSVPALDSILQLSDEAVKKIEAENQESMKRGFQGLLVGISQLVISVLMVAFVPFYFKIKFVRPLNDIVLTLKNIREGNVNNPTPHTQRTDEIGKLAHGADMLKNSIIEEQMLKKELEKTVLKLEDLSIKDSLTALYNRRKMTEWYEEVVKRYKRTGKVFSVIMCDIDHFKSFNDRYGHECGDKVLIYISNQLSLYSREYDVLSRWGGEEFLFLLPDTNREDARALAEAIRTGLESAKYECDLLKLDVTMTFGVTEYCEGEGLQDTVRKADMALLQGKKSGRNQVVVF